jgi:LmbE family N-acetylglucosaminyl deacetylase
LVKILKALMDYFQPEVIEYVYPGNHVDHQYVAKFAALAERAYQRDHMAIRYRDYNISKYPPNLDGFDNHLKWLIAQCYGKYDRYFPKYGFERMFYRYYGWCERQYYYENRKDETGGKLPLSVELTKKLNSLWLYRPVTRPKLAPLLKK